MAQNVPLNISEQEVIWLAGYLEGERFFRADKSLIDLSSTDEDVVKRVARMFGETVKWYNKPGYFKHEDTSKWKTQYRVYVGGCKARTIMKMILPWMGKRRKERIEECLAYYKDSAPARNEPTAQATSGITGEQTV